MKLDELQGPRFDLAVDRLRAGHAIEYAGLILRVGSDDVLECDVPSTWWPENVTEATATADLRRAEVTLSAVFRALDQSGVMAPGSRPRLTLADDYGKGSMALGVWEGGEIRWARTFRPLA